MASNMIRFGQLIETNYTMRFEDKELKVFGRSSKNNREVTSFEQRNIQSHDQHA